MKKYYKNIIFQIQASKSIIFFFLFYESNSEYQIHILHYTEKNKIKEKYTRGSYPPLQSFSHFPKINQICISNPTHYGTHSHCQINPKLETDKTPKKGSHQARENRVWTFEPNQPIPIPQKDTTTKEKTARKFILNSL